MTEQYTTKDEFSELSRAVKSIQDSVDTLGTDLGSLQTLVDRINQVGKMKDVVITYLTEGDILQYSNDGRWHNVQPYEISGGSGGSLPGGTTAEIIKNLIVTEGSKLFISKRYDDVAKGVIEFEGTIIADKEARLKAGAQFGNFTSGYVGGHGAKIDGNGDAEMNSLILRDFLQVPELRFNKVDVVSGELWNSVAFGTIEDVDTVNKIVTVKLEEGEYSGIKVNDICRGVFHNIDGVNDTVSETDENGFDKVAGFTTAYFTPVDILDDYGKKFVYSLKPGTTQHPSKSMKFVVYGNFTDETRRRSAYATKTYKRYLKNVDTWAITSANIASQFGNLDGLNIPGAPNDGNLEGDGAYLTNVYMTGALIKFTPEQLEDLKGKDGYSVSLTSYNTTVVVDNDLNIIDDYQSKSKMQFSIQAFKGETELKYTTIYNEGAYFATFEAHGVECNLVDGTFTITKILDISDMHIDIKVNCEGVVTFKQKFTLTYMLEANGLWVTYNDNDATPDKPTGDGTTNGWHRNFTSSAIWMSSKSTRKVTEGEWGDPVRFVGASTIGQDGRYIVFVYKSSSVKPDRPTDNYLPPTGWSMAPPQRSSDLYHIWMSQAIVKPDKTLAVDSEGHIWTDPIRITGDNGKDGEDGTTYEFIYFRNSGATPNKPTSEQQDDYIPAGWTDNPQGVTETLQYEWVCVRQKEKKVWGAFSVPVIWAKWGEKGMDGDGYEYIFTRTADVDTKPKKPLLSLNYDDFIPTITNGGSSDYNWSDDPKGVSEESKAEWVSVRKKEDGNWGEFKEPSLWSNWGEPGLSGGHYEYRLKISAEKPALPTDDLAEGWSNAPELVPGKGEYVWQITRFVAADGTVGKWENLIRLTGNDGKDGEDGNSIEFVYATKGNNEAPQTPETTQVDDWTGRGPDGTFWFDNPQGVTAVFTHEYVSQRQKDKKTQLWGDYSRPALWARYSERGKDGDGYEYVFRRSNTYLGISVIGKGGSWYPSTTTPSADSTGKTYQDDDFIPLNYTDNPVGPTEELQYEYVWTRKKKDSVWQDWKDGSLWSRWSKDGDKGDKGDTGDKGDAGEDGEPGYTYVINPSNFNLRITKTGTYDPSSATFTLTRMWVDKTGAAHSDNPTVQWKCFVGNSENPTALATLVNSGVNGVLLNFASTNRTHYYLVCALTADDLTVGNYIASLSFQAVYDGTDGEVANAQYVITRSRGIYDATKTYYYSDLKVADPTNYQTYPNSDDCRIRDFVLYKGRIYFVKSYNATEGIVGKEPSSTSTYWTASTYEEIVATNTMLADNAKLGDFNFSNSVFTSDNGKLSMDSNTGKFIAQDAEIKGKVVATEGEFAGNLIANSLSLKYSLRSAESDGSYYFATSKVVLPEVPENRLKIIKIYNPLDTRTTPQDLLLEPKNSNVVVTLSLSLYGITGGNKTIEQAGTNSSKIVELTGIGPGASQYISKTIWAVSNIIDTSTLITPTE